ncbi:MAG TPA: family 2 encapsulin nanocompartment cargo protein polyprenyl transferase [Stackebrandtia sp.]|jgi:geranylgeranyl diphosphate synthase type I|uniref:family 2 encapsulin nanocompartment cargo protein polyprenyl transferase n=1 Tax=Stackebrandtia sp. TaxID=2023065 RepID=UPI002D2AB6AC|nr:family 2 encapsulin nanocompartment cargo protein polyprenyl transferase [Stackebrandtia sp.]HZE41111.1 family 2 encapsulin nanocompartment cargo protein polyprenyl transferase [Stackebrandtia sp.]
MDTVDTAATARQASDILAEARRTVEPALRDAVGSLPEPTRHIAGYHFGWWDRDGVTAAEDSGKALRPALVLLCAKAVGGSASEALPAAVAVELVHNFSLVHDDVIDRDLTRRHRATVWAVFGEAAAILVGDALSTLATDVLAASGHRGALDGVRMLGAAIQSLIDGQHADLAFCERADIGIEECGRMAEAKTGALLRCACALGARFGGGTAEQVAELGDFGADLGLAFQHVDDLLGIWGDPAVTGKPVYSDLRNRKKSLPVVAALSSHTPATAALSELYARTDALSDAEVARAATLIDEAGGREYSRAQSDLLVRRSRDRLRRLGPAESAHRELEALADLITRRDH